jgi:hypothetical protein
MPSFRILIIYLYTINWLVVTTEKSCVLCEEQTDAFHCTPVLRIFTAQNFILTEMIKLHHKSHCMNQDHEFKTTDTPWLTEQLRSARTRASQLLYKSEPSVYIWSNAYVYTCESSWKTKPQHNGDSLTRVWQPYHLRYCPAVFFCPTFASLCFHSNKGKLRMLSIFLMCESETA